MLAIRRDIDPAGTGKRIGDASGQSHVRSGVGEAPIQQRIAAGIEVVDHHQTAGGTDPGTPIQLRCGAGNRQATDPVIDAERIDQRQPAGRQWACCRVDREHRQGLATGEQPFAARLGDQTCKPGRDAVGMGRIEGRHARHPDPVEDRDVGRSTDFRIVRADAGNIDPVTGQGQFTRCQRQTLTNAAKEGQATEIRRCRVGRAAECAQGRRRFGIRGEIEIGDHQRRNTEAGALGNRKTQLVTGLDPDRARAAGRLVGAQGLELLAVNAEPGHVAVRLALGDAPVKTDRAGLGCAGMGEAGEDCGAAVGRSQRYLAERRGHAGAAASEGLGGRRPARGFELAGEIGQDVDRGVGQHVDVESVRTDRKIQRAIHAIDHGPRVAGIVDPVDFGLEQHHLAEIQARRAVAIKGIEAVGFVTDDVNMTPVGTDHNAITGGVDRTGQLQEVEIARNRRDRLTAPGQAVDQRREQVTDGGTEDVVRAEILDPDGVIDRLARGDLGTIVGGGDPKSGLADQAADDEVGGDRAAEHHAGVVAHLAGRGRSGIDLEIETNLAAGLEVDFGQQRAGSCRIDTARLAAGIDHRCTSPCRSGIIQCIR